MYLNAFGVNTKINIVVWFWRMLPRRIWPLVKNILSLRWVVQRPFNREVKRFRRIFFDEECGLPEEYITVWSFSGCSNDILWSWWFRVEAAVLMSISIFLYMHFLYMVRQFLYMEGQFLFMVRLAFYKQEHKIIPTNIYLLKH